MNFPIKKIYYEPEALSYNLGKALIDKYNDKEWIPIENHNNIPMFRNKQNSEFAKMKQNIIIGVRKTHKYTKNNKTSDFLVPYTSSGCSAACLYCYLVCNYNKCSYLRLFVNREQMLNKIIKTLRNSQQPLTLEIGSNSDLILENTITNNLVWTIENLPSNVNGFLTLPTKFDMVDPILNLDHHGKIIIRMSVNPEYIIKKVEFGTSNLKNRINAINKLAQAGYKIGILIAPVIMVDNWHNLYKELLDILYYGLSQKAKDSISIEVIFMTYSYIHRMINKEAFQNAIELYDQNLMTGRGPGKYRYKQQITEPAKIFLKDEITKRFPKTKIEYMV